MRINKLSHIWLLWLLVLGCNEKPLKINYQTTFESNGGLPDPQAQSIARDNKVRRPAAMTRAGYTFTGWYSDTDLMDLYDFSVPVKTALTLYAGWKLTSYRVMFEPNGGIPFPQDKTVLYGDMVRRPAAMTRPGYIFKDWYSDSALTRLYDFSVPVKTTLTLYAGWKLTSYRVMFEPNGGIPFPQDKTVLYGDMVRRPAAMTKSGYVFKDWYSDSTLTRLYDFSAPVKTTLTLYAGWSLDSYRVAFETKGGIPAPRAQVISYGDTVRRPAAMTKSGYVFRGWYSDSTLTRLYNFLIPLRTELKLYANWVPVRYMVHFNPDGGLYAPQAQVISHGDILHRPAAMTKKGYVFKEWYSDSTLTHLYNFSVPVKTNLALYASWSLINYKVAFEPKGGLPAPQDRVVLQDGIVRRPAAMTKTGYTFRDWYSDVGLTRRYDFSSPVTSALTLYAGWDVDEYKVTFESNGGFPAPQAQLVSYGDTVRLPAAMTKLGYVFRGWYSDAQLTRLYNLSSQVTATLKLYAGWGLMTPVTSSVIEGKYFVFDVSIPWKLTQNLVLQGSFTKDNIANYANDNDYEPKFEYSENFGNTWYVDNDMKHIRIKRGKTSVRVRIRTNADTQKEVLYERIKVVFSPVGIVPAQAAAFTHKTTMVIEDDDVLQTLRRLMNPFNHELMVFEVKNNVFTLSAVIDSVNNQREKQVVDSLHKELVDAVRAVNLGSPAKLNFFSINFQQPKLGAGSLVLGFVRPSLDWQSPPNDDVAFVTGFELSLNAATAFWQLRAGWSSQPFNRDGFFGKVVAHEFGHLLTLNRTQGSYVLSAGTCNNLGGMFAGDANRCFRPRSYGERLLSDFYDSASVKPVSKPNLIPPALVSAYAGTNSIEDLAESFAAYVGLEENQVVSDTTYSAYRNKIAMYKAFPEAVNFKQLIINTKLKVQKTGLSANLSAANSFVIDLGDGGNIELKYGGDEGCVREPIFR